MLDYLYVVVLGLHNITRWLVLCGGVAALTWVAWGWLSRRPWNAGHVTVIRWFTRVLGIQFLLGLSLYLLPIGFVQAVVQNTAWPVIMKDRLLRFFTLEHPSTMLIAIVIANIALSIAIRMRAERSRFAWVSLLLILSMGLIFSAIPWPFSSYARPWLRLPF